MKQISVIMAVKNGDKFLNSAVRSILCQDYSDFEFLIYNDGSADKTADILNSYDDNRIQIYHSVESRGLASALNYLIANSSGKYIARMDADDIAHPERFRQQVEYLEKHPDVAVLGTNSYLIDEYDKFIGVRIMPSCSDEIKRVIHEKNCVIHPSVMMRKEIIFPNFLYNQKLKRGQDRDLWMRLIAANYKLANHNQKLMSYRVGNYNRNFRFLWERLHSQLTLAIYHRSLWIMVSAVFLFFRDGVRYVKKFIGS